MAPPDSDPSRTDAEDDGGFVVNDRRWWAAGDDPEPASTEADEPAADPDPEPESVEISPRLIEYLQEQLADRDRKLEAALERQRKALAELDKARERIERDAARQLELARRDLVRQQLDLLDDLERAIEAAGDSADGALLDGVSLVARRFVSKLGELGITAEDPTGQPFDPARHDAVSLVPVTDPAQDGVVIGAIKKGYMLGDEPLRPALVAVGKLG